MARSPSSEEIARQIRAAHSRNPGAPHQQIADETGYSLSTVGKYRPARTGPVAPAPAAAIPPLGGEQPGHHSGGESGPHDGLASAWDEFSADALLVLAASGDDDVRLQAAMTRTSAAGDALDWLASDPDPAVRRAVAANPHTPPEALERVAESGIGGDEAVAANPNCPLPLLLEFAASGGPQKNYEAALQALLNPSFPSERLADMAVNGVPDDWEFFTRQGFVLRNPSCPQEALLAVLEGDYEIGFKMLAVGNPNCPAEEIARHAPNSLFAPYAAANPSCPAPVIERLAAEGDKQARLAAASNPACPAEALTVLASDSDTAVAAAAARNPACPAEALRVLAAHHSDQVAAAAAAHPNTGDDTLNTLLSHPARRISRLVAARRRMRYP